MNRRTPKRTEQMLADMERWRLEIAEELGLIENVSQVRYPLGPHPVLRPQHQRPNSTAKQRNNS